MSKRIVLAVDQSFTSTGVAILNLYTGELIKTMTINTKKTSEDPLQLFTRMADISDTLMDIIHSYQVTDFCIEGLAMGRIAGNSNRDLAGLQGHIMCNVMTVIKPENIAILPPTQVKKHATGKGNAKKEEMYDALPDVVKERIEVYKKTKGRYDVTDAYFIGMTYINNFEKST